MMYVNLLKERIRAVWEGIFGRGLRRSGVAFWLALGALVLIPGWLWHLHTRGRFHTLKSEIRGERPSTVEALPRPGGVDPVMLTRGQTPGDNQPQFLSATILPGLGMGVLQITAFLPNRGEVPLLVAPTLSAMADGTAGPRVGMNDARGALEVPWSGGLTGIVSPLGTAVTTSWKNRTIEVPTDAAGRRGVAEGGLLAMESAEASQAMPMPDGSSATGTFRATDFAGHWPSKTDVSVGVQMGARTLDVLVTAKNVGDQPEPMGIGWHPRFAIPSGRREAAELRLPNGERLETGGAKIRGLSAGGDLGRFTGRVGELGTESFDESLIRLKSGIMDKGPSAELRDRASGFGLRVTATSETTREFRVTSPAGSGYVSIGTQTNLDDPLGKQWAGLEGQGIATLQPGQSAEWKVRLEIFPVLNR